MTAADDSDPIAATDPRPQVAMPRAGMPTWALGVLAATLGGVVLLALNARRAEADRPVTDRGGYATAIIPPMPSTLTRLPGAILTGEGTVPRPLPVYATRPAPFAQPIDRWPQPRENMAAPAPFSAPPASRTSFNSEGGSGPRNFRTEPMPGGLGTASAATTRTAGSPGSAVVYDAGQRPGTGFGDDKGNPDGSAARASVIRNRPGVVAQGEILPATLETPVSSNRPGPIRAVIARDVRGFDGSRVLIPRGSRLIGEYRADPQAAKRRVLVTWTRLIRPDGVAIRIDSPGADGMGGIGLPGKVDTHFLAKFANAALQSALQIGVNLASRAGNGAVIVSNTPQLPGAMGQGIIPGADEPPTVSVRAGAAISVFVARDLDFGGVPVLR